MNETETARKITAYLDRSAVQLKAGTAYKLQLAREAALNVAAHPERAPELVLVDGTLGSRGGRRPVFAQPRLLIGVLLIVGGFVAFQSWQTAQQQRDIEETDAALLTSELPIEAYLDRGFQNWLQQSQR